MIMRESVLLSKILLSAESWHKLFQYQIDKLEEVDKIFYRKLFNSHPKTGEEFFFSETGTISIKLKLSMRRLIYWWNILHVNKSEMIYKVYKAQKLSPVGGDWIHLLDRDKQQFGIHVSDEHIQTVSLYKFKQFVKKKASELMIRYLLGLQQKHSKSKYIDVEDLEMSPYLLDSRFNKVEREMLFKLRSRTISTKENFPNAYLNNDMLCQLCKLFPCTQFHVLQCSSLVTSLIVDKSVKLDEKDVYGTVDQQLLFVKIYVKFWDLREEMLDNIKKQKNDEQSVR